MRVYGRVEVILDKEEEKRIARESFYAALKKCGYDWGPSHFIHNDKVYVTKTYSGSHTWSTEDFKRDATETDRLLVQLLMSL
jgi:hypothetical protein